MASQKKIIEMIGSIKTIYPYYAKDTDVELLVKTWTVLLKDYPDKAVDVAFYKCLQTCKMPPTPADVIEQLNSMIETTEQSPEELWTKLLKTFDKVKGYAYQLMTGCYQIGVNPHAEMQKIWDNLDEELQQYIGSKGELMRMSRFYTDEDLKFEKNKFLKQIPVIRKRKDTAKMVLLLGDEKLLIE